jgi:flagellin-like protein
MRNGSAQVSRWNATRRGVSPIIATILLVAITVVIAAVLYVIVSGYLRASQATPTDIELGGVTFTHKGNPATIYYVNFSTITSSPSISTDDFGLKIQSSTNGQVVSFAYANLTNPAGKVVAVFTPTSNSWNTTISLQQGDAISFNTGIINLQGSGDPILAYGLAGSSVSGGYAAGL